MAPHRRCGTGNPAKEIQLKTLQTGALVPITSDTTNVGYVIPVVPSRVQTCYYKLTAINADGAESEPTTALTVALNLFAEGAYTTLTWSAPTTGTAVRYRVYKAESGLYGYLGETENTNFRDDNISPDLSITPPIPDLKLEGSGYYPGCVSYFEQRRCFAGSTNEPQSLYMTRSGTESDMSYSLPTRDDDRISVAVAARQNNTIRHIVPLQDMILLTSSAEWRVTSVNSDAITPTSIAVRPQSYIGASSVQPIVTNQTIVFAAARGGHVREMGFSTQAGSYIVGDLSLRAAHLFDEYTIVAMAQSKAPLPILWFVRSDGYLLGCTYVPEEQIAAWHWHDTDGAFESISAGPEGSEDRLYAIVRRTINGSTVRTVECMGSQASPAALDDAFQVDCGLTYDSTPATTISGITHLPNEAVSVLADGRVVEGKTVSAGGAITLSTAASVVHVGLPYTCDLQTLPLAVQVEAFSHGRTKNVNRVWMRCTDSGAFEVGPDVTHLRSSDPRGENAGTFVSGQVMVPVDGKWTDDGQVWLRQSDPLPVTIVGQVLEVSIGG